MDEGFWVEGYNSIVYKVMINHMQSLHHIDWLQKLPLMASRMDGFISFAIKIIAKYLSIANI